MTRARRPAVAAPEATVRRCRAAARLLELLREIIADELTRYDDERLELVTVTAVDVDPELNRAIVFFDSLRGPEGDDDVIAALGERRVRLQAAIGRQVHARKTPVLMFRPDEVIRAAERIDEILRQNPLPPGDEGNAPAAPAPATPDDPEAP